MHDTACSRSVATVCSTYDVTATVLCSPFGRALFPSVSYYATAGSRDLRGHILQSAERLLERPVLLIVVPRVGAGREMVPPSVSNASSAPNSRSLCLEHFFFASRSGFDTSREVGTCHYLVKAVTSFDNCVTISSLERKLPHCLLNCIAIICRM